MAARLPAEPVHGKDYLVVGTVDRTMWHRGKKTLLAVANALEHVHDFAEIVQFKLPRSHS
jgi:hypothetical protein